MSTANVSNETYSQDYPSGNTPVFYISDFDISTNLTTEGKATGIDDVSLNKHQDLSYDVVVVCDLSLNLIKETFCVLADSNLELDQNAPTNTADLSYVYNVAKAGELVDDLFSRNANSIRGFKAQSNPSGTLSDTDGPEFDEANINYDDNGDDTTAGSSKTTYGQTDTSRCFGNGQVQDDFMRHLSYRLFNVPTAADVLENSLNVTLDFRKSYLEAFTTAIVLNSAEAPADVSFTFAHEDGAVSTVLAENQTGATVIDFTANEAGSTQIDYLPSVASEKLWDKLVTYSRNENRDDTDGSNDARWGDISGNSTEGISGGNDRTRIQMLLKNDDQLVFLLRVNFAAGQLAATGMDGRRTSRVYKIVANLKE